MTPFINADAFARFAVDIGIASAGIEGRVTLLDAEMRTTGELGLALDTSGDLVAYDVFSGDRARETLSGRLSAYAKVGLGICCNKKFSHKIFGWRGLKKTDRLYRISREARLVSTKPVNEETSSNLQVSTPQGKVPEGPWGGWQPPGVCPMGSYAFAAAQKIVPKRGKKKDDLGLAGLMFRCRTPGGVETKAVWSTNLNVGEWSEWGQCPKGEAFVGYRIKLQKKQGKKKDDTAANEIEFVCGDGTKVNKVVKGAGRWGTWRKGQRCKAGARIDHFSLKVESGKKKDHTGVNAIKVRCREYRKVKTGDKRTLSCPSGKLEGTRCRLADADLDAFPTKCAQRGKCGCGLSARRASRTRGVLAVSTRTLPGRRPRRREASRLRHQRLIGRAQPAGRRGLTPSSSRARRARSAMCASSNSRASRRLTPRRARRPGTGARARSPSLNSPGPTSVTSGSTPSARGSSPSPKRDNLQSRSTLGVAHWPPRGQSIAMNPRKIVQAAEW